MKRKNRFLILSIIFASLALVCFILGLSYCVSMTNLEKEIASVIYGIFFTVFAYGLAILTVAFVVLGGVFSVLALKTQKAKALHITILTGGFFTLEVLDWIYILTRDRDFLNVPVELYFGFFAIVLTYIVIVLGALGGIFSALALRKQESKKLYITTLTVSSLLAMVSLVWNILFYTGLIS